MPQPAEFSSITVGDIKITFLPDGGGIVIPTALYPASTEAGWKKHTDLLNEEGKFVTSIGGFLIETGEQKIIVDTGIGPVYLDFPGFGPFFGGKYLESLQKSGVSREEVTDLIFTHMHLDHVGWTSIEIGGRRELTFPNARHLVTAAEWESWHGGDSPIGPHPEFVQKPLEGRLTMIAPGDTPAPGITVLSTPGHSPGHISLLLTSGDQRAYLLADVVHGAMQFQEPEWSVAFDTDPVLARQSREGLYEALIKPNTIAIANHFSNTVFGRVVKEGDSYRWVPL
jgi:glyoxylase-like metal-dependent hydrolase (beta-lactamase superfamily II)